MVIDPIRYEYERIELSNHREPNLRTLASGIVHAVHELKRTAIDSDGHPHAEGTVSVRACTGTGVDLNRSQWTEEPVGCGRCIRLHAVLHENTATQKTD